MNYDISGMLRGWEYDPGSISARWIKGKDSKLKIQLRLDLGLFQMESEGRPDGTHPRGYPSLLDYYRSIEKTSPAAAQSMKLDGDACAELQQEAMQYYYRYLSLYALHFFEGVVRDTDHNLALIELVSRHAENDDLAWQFLQFYPYVRMMNARARAEKAMGSKQYEEAVGDLHRALDDIQAFWREYNDTDGGDRQEIDLLTDLLTQVQKKTPRSPVDRLREQLAQAIAVENYEKAAMLRDKLGTMVTSAAESKPKTESG
ncbi:MAG: hypothetical protein BWK77_08835 [Verrucomicrobia bacterium A1]|nr:MAG: hypothetical protein BWK77_08835 [Verrucomicrobia bacterium A1]